MRTQNNTRETGGQIPGDGFVCLLPDPSRAPDAETAELATRVGGKARSLVRLRGLGLPTPVALVVTTELAAAIGHNGDGHDDNDRNDRNDLRPAPPPVGLRSLADLTALAATRRRWLAVPFPEGFREQLDRGLNHLTCAIQREQNQAGVASSPAFAPVFAVRSSSPTEDNSGGLAPGIFASELRVKRDDVESAIRKVLASTFSPAAWSYLTQQTVPGNLTQNEMAVLIHPFVSGDAWGATAWDPARRNSPPHIAIEGGRLNAIAQATILTAVRRAADTFGASEIEWVADGASVVFLQLRPYRSGASSGSRLPSPSVHATVDETWSWDAAHNPDPLSAAHTGLVQWVDRVCATPFEQRVVDGYLYARPRSLSNAGVRIDASDLDVHADAHPFDRSEFDALVIDTVARIDAAGTDASIETALQLFAQAYEPLFAVISPACVRARQQLKVELSRSFGSQSDGGRDLDLDLGFWLGGVSSAATRRTDAARDIANARDGGQREMALARYLASFGDESPRWDIAEPTWRERPERLLWATAATESVIHTHTAEGGAVGASGASGAVGSTATDSEREARFGALAPPLRLRLAMAVASARAAAAVMEDDDAFYGKLQALVRRSLLRLGRRLQREGRLDAADDVFHLPLDLARSLDDDESAPASPRAPKPWRMPHGNGTDDPAAARDPKGTARAGLAAWQAYRQHPPTFASAGMVATDSSGTFGVVRGSPGASGHAIGHAVHHPSFVPLGAGAILIASTLLPTELPLMFPAAIVAETGSMFGHVAAQARERGIPAVVNVAGARAAIPPGALVVVDGDRGDVTWRVVD